MIKKRTTNNREKKEFPTKYKTTLIRINKGQQYREH